MIVNNHDSITFGIYQTWNIEPPVYGLQLRQRLSCIRDHPGLDAPLLAFQRHIKQFRVRDYCELKVTASPTVSAANKKTTTKQSL